MAKIEGGITWGNIWSIGATIVAVTVSFTTLQAGLLEGQREMKRIELQGTQATSELRLTRALTTDRHFRQMGFTVVPGR